MVERHTQHNEDFMDATESIRRGRMTTNEILTVAEVAVELRCSKAHVYNMIAGKVDGVGALPAISMGRRKLVRRVALTQWMATNETAADGNIASSSAIDTGGRMKEKFQHA
jgi:excisionase family DNA binding protein